MCVFDCMYYDECVTAHDRIAFIPLTISNLMTSVREVGCWSEEVTISEMYSEYTWSRCELQLATLQAATAYCITVLPLLGTSTVKSRGDVSCSSTTSTQYLYLVPCTFTGFD